MDEKIKEIVSNISYSNYGLVRSGAFWSAFLTNIANGYLNNIPLYGFTYTTAVLYVFLVFSRLENHTKELTAIRSAYSDVLDNYAKLMHDLGLSNPIQIGTMHTNMVEDGYLSINNEFKFNRDNVYDYKGIYGTNIINGHGVCRHNASLLSDLLNKMEIDAFNLAVCFPDYALSIEILDGEVGQTRDEIYATVRKYFIDPNAVDQIVEALDEIIKSNGAGIKVSLSCKEEKNILKRVLGNHAICFAEQNGHGYYLDPTMKRIYYMDSEEFGILRDENIERLNMKLYSSCILNNLSTFEKMYGKVLNDNPSDYRATRLVDETTLLYENNRDICEQFYRDNEEIYRNIVHNLSYLKANHRSR